jgi:hypothetical protein
MAIVFGLLLLLGAIVLIIVAGWWGNGTKGQGRTGRRGRRGATGPDGVDGLDGLDGGTGPQGATGGSTFSNALSAAQVTEQMVTGGTVANVVFSLSDSSIADGWIPALNGAQWTPPVPGVYEIAYTVHATSVGNATSPGRLELQGLTQNPAAAPLGGNTLFGATTIADQTIVTLSTAWCVRFVAGQFIIVQATATGAGNWFLDFGNLSAHFVHA